LSLAVVNDQDDAPMLAPLRVAALVRREGGNEGVDRLYRALGEALHEGGRDLRRPGEAETAIRAALEAGGFPPDLLPRALADQSTLDEVTRETREAQQGCGAYGVPWLVLGGRAFGFHGPVIAEVPRGEEAAELWEHTSWLLSRPYFYEMKRERDHQHA
jgi:2-hydroxychromene-2-carboxylate isomerase